MFDINHRDRCGKTALHYKWLVECDLSPMEYAIFKGYTDVVTYLTCLNPIGIRQLPSDEFAKDLIKVDIL